MLSRIHLRGNRRRPVLAAAMLAAALLAATGSQPAAAGVAAAAVAAAAAADVPAHPVQDPHYGDTLFQFFQGRYFTAVTNLMVSQHFERVPHHADEAEVLRGGMMLSFGMHREAGEIFASLIEKGAAPPVRDRAWFYLAKIRYQRGLMAEAADALAHIENHLPPALEDERGLLQANVMMARGDYAGAAGVLGALKTQGTAGAYARFNLGVALMKGGDPARGTLLLDELGRSPAADEEVRGLRDKANVALGLTAMQDKQPQAARTYLERVRLQGMESNKALLGFGWAADALKQPTRALVPWMELAARDPSDSAVLEARIAVPYAYAELGAYGQSLARYNEAITAFDQERVDLDESIAAIRAGTLVDGLMARNPGEQMGWFWNIRELPDMPHAAHLAPLLARHEFQEAFKNYRDLRFLEQNLRDWADKLGVYGDMLANRRQAYDQRLPRTLDNAQAGERGLDNLQRRRDALVAEFGHAESAADGVAFASAHERELMQRLADAQAVLDKHPGQADVQAVRERVQHAAGAMRWQLAEQFPARVWETRKSLATIDAELASARRHDEALAQAQRDEPARFARFAARISELDARLQALIPRVASLTTEQQQAVQDIAVAELTHQKDRLAVYSTQARFAIAQLVDRANSANQALEGAKP